MGRRKITEENILECEVAVAIIEMLRDGEWHKYEDIEWEIQRKKWDAGKKKGEFYSQKTVKNYLGLLRKFEILEHRARSSKGKSTYRIKPRRIDAIEMMFRKKQYQRLSHQAKWHGYFGFIGLNPSTITDDKIKDDYYKLEEEMVKVAQRVRKIWMGDMLIKYLITVKEIIEDITNEEQQLMMVGYFHHNVDWWIKVHRLPKNIIYAECQEEILLLGNKDKILEMADKWNNDISQKLREHVYIDKTNKKSIKKYFLIDVMNEIEAERNLSLMDSIDIAMKKWDYSPPITKEMRDQYKIIIEMIDMMNDCFSQYWKKKGQEKKPLLPLQAPIIFLDSTLVQPKIQGGSV